MKIEEKYKLIEESKKTGRCTLNSHPAHISGAKLSFAVVSINHTCVSCDFSWPAIKRIMKNGGKFKY